MSKIYIHHLSSSAEWLYGSFSFVFESFFPEYQAILISYLNRLVLDVFFSLMFGVIVTAKVNCELFII